MSLGKGVQRKGCLNVNDRSDAPADSQGHFADPLNSSYEESGVSPDCPIGPERLLRSEEHIQREEGETRSVRELYTRHHAVTTIQISSEQSEKTKGPGESEGPI
jgi:hypothetical protein